MTNETPVGSPGLRLLFAAALLGSVMLSLAAPKESPRTFATPMEAVQATIEAAERNDTAALFTLFGPEGKDIVESGDPAEDRNHRAEFALRAREKVRIEQDRSRPDRATVVIGAEEWPFPVPLVRTSDGKWQLDSVTGRIEVRARRIGRNQLNALEVCRGYAEAQLEYASEVRDGDKVLQYAQKVTSTPGRHDGLYEEASPAGGLVSKAFTEAVAADPSGAGKDLRPYHGYYFRVLKSQGQDANGGMEDYVVNGKMIGGFAMVAWPAEYGVSGIRTFMINHEGKVYQKDLGERTPANARLITRFNPDGSWRPVVLE